MALTQSQKQLGIGLLASGAVAFIVWALSKSSNTLTEVDGSGQQTTPSTSAIGAPVSSPNDSITNYDPFTYNGPSYPSTSYGVPENSGGFSGYLLGNAPNNGSNTTLGPPLNPTKIKSGGCGGDCGCSGGSSAGKGCGGCAEATQLAVSTTSQVGSAPTGFFSSITSGLQTYYNTNPNLPGGGGYYNNGSPYSDADTGIGA